MNKIIFFLIPIIFLFQAAHADVLIENDQKYIDDDNLLHIVGEIVNYTDKPISQIEISATTFSSTDSKITTINSNTPSHTIMPGMKAGFDILFLFPSLDFLSKVLWFRSRKKPELKKSCLLMIFTSFGEMVMKVDLIFLLCEMHAPVPVVWMKSRDKKPWKAVVFPKKFMHKVVNILEIMPSGFIGVMVMIRDCIISNSCVKKVEAF